jgi:hypothetical protein
MRIRVHLSRKIGFVVSCLLVFSLFVADGKSLAQEFKTIHDGVEYAKVELKLGEDPVKINLLRLDLTKVRLDVHKALDKAIGLETTSSIANRKGAVAAINAGFFRLDSSEFAGDASGSLMIDGSMLSESSNERIAIAIRNRSNRTEVAFGHLGFTRFLEVRGRVFDVGLNRELGRNDIVEYTKAVGTIPERSGRVDFILVDSRVDRIRDDGSTQLGPSESLLSATGTKAAELRSLLQIGSRVRLYQVTMSVNATDSRVFFRAEDITNGVPQLIKDGKIDITWEQEKAGKAFVFNRHPRTVVAKMKDGKFLMITVDGRQPGVSVGMTLQELAEYLLSLGAVDAMNLDGGGSTTMVLDGKVVNKPSDPTGERKIGDAIVVTLRKTARPASRKN